MRKYIILVLTVCVGVVADQYTKHWANQSLFTPEHPAVVAISEANASETLDSILKKRFPGWSETERKQALVSQTIALKKEDGLNPDYRVPERTKLYIFERRDLSVPPRKLMESTHTFLMHWFTQVLQMPYLQARKHVDDHLTERTYLTFIKEKMVALSDAGARELLANFTYRQDYARRIRGDSSVSPGELYVVQINHQAVIIPNFFYFSYIENPGAAWGFMASSEPLFRRRFFMSITAAALIFILVLFYRLSQRQIMLVGAFSLILAGAVGNFIDRFKFNYVIDFIDFRYYDVFRWPTFNIADLLITAGVILLVFDLVRSRGRHLSTP